MNYTPELIEPDNPQRIVPHDEGAARLSAIRESIEAMPEPCKTGASIWMNHQWNWASRTCSRCHAPMPALKI